MEAKILKVLETQDFFDWYNEKFEAYIQGETNNRDEILEDVKKMFTLG